MESTVHSLEARQVELETEIRRLEIISDPEFTDSLSFLGPPLPDLGQLHKRVRRHDNFKFTFLGCGRAGALVHCKLNIKNYGISRLLTIADAKLLRINLNNFNMDEYRAQRLVLGRGLIERGEIARLLITDVPVVAMFEFEVLPSDLESSQILEFKSGSGDSPLEVQHFLTHVKGAPRVLPDQVP
ncbi:MAG TPA: hypothetical protein VN493_30960 [Thermoanaerobaculia bacterium]|nr:hypothetical protein [Thermoanaerobaculia bacterium]